MGDPPSTAGVASALLFAPATADAAVEFSIAPIFNADIVKNTGDTDEVPFDDPASTRSTGRPRRSQPPGATPSGCPGRADPRQRERAARRAGLRRGPQRPQRLVRPRDPGPAIIDVPDGKYGSVHAFAASSEGDTNVRLTQTYATGPTFVTDVTVQDWFNDVANPPSYFVADNMDRLTSDGSNGVFGSPCADISGTSDNPALFGLRFEADEARVLVSVTFERLAGGNRLAVFGFVGEAAQLTVAKSGGGGGTVAGDGIDCGEDCSHVYDFGPPVENVTLTATPEPNTSFAGWSGACTGTETCSLTMDDDRAVSAQFEPINHELTVTKSGDGAGTVTSNPAGIDCGADCAETLRQGTVVTLTPAAAPGSQFVRWDGACTGTTFECTVTMDAAKTVTARFGAVIADDFGLPRDVLAPRLTATVPRRMRHRALRRGVPVRFTCSENCTLFIAVGRGTRTIRSTTTTGLAGVRKTVRVRLSARARRGLRRGSRRLRFRLTAADAAATPGRRPRTLRLRR